MRTMHSKTNAGTPSRSKPQGSKPQGRSIVARGFTLIELLVVIAIIVILVAILFPVFSRARENARKSACASNLKQISLGFLQYNQDHDGRFPQAWDLMPGKNPGTTDCNSPANCLDTASTNEPVVWPAKLEPYLKNRQVYSCPSANKVLSSPCLAVATNRDRPLAWGATDMVIGTAISNWFLGASQVAYGYNAIYLGGGQFVSRLSIQNGKNPSAANCWTCGVPALEAELAEAASTVLLSENTTLNGGVDGSPAFANIWAPFTDSTGDYWCSASGAADGYDAFAPRHNGGMNVAFTDGHVKWMRKETLMYRAATFSAPTDTVFLWDR